MSSSLSTRMPALEFLTPLKLSDEADVMDGPPGAPCSVDDFAISCEKNNNNNNKKHTHKKNETSVDF